MKGYVIVSQGPYTEMAELLKRSIEKTQSTVKDVHIISDLTGDVMLNRTQIYKLSPFDETVMLDADMIFFNDVSHWWDHFSKFPLLITNKVKDYRGNFVDFPYRKTFIENNLPNCYCAFTYFSKNKIAEQFFDLLEIIVKDWDQWSGRFAPNFRPAKPSIDVAMAIAIKASGLDNVFTSLDYPTFTHMKPECQGWTKSPHSWTTYLNLTIEGSRVKLGNYTQDYILHYVDKNVSRELLQLF